MDIEVGARAVVLQGEPPVCREPLKEGEFVNIVAMKPASCGGLCLTVNRDGEATPHGAHSSGVVAVKGPLIAAMSASEMVARYFAVLQAWPLIRGDKPEFELLFDELGALEESITKTPSRSHADFVAKLQYAAHHSGDDICDWMPAFLDTLGGDYSRMIEFVEGVGEAA
jgi:hypothetical protein